MAVDTPARHVYTGNGNTRVFPIPTRIIGDDYVRIEVDNIHLTDRTQWDIVNNSVIFLTAPINGSEINIQVATSEEALSVLGSVTNVDIVAENIKDVNNVANSIISINTTATNIASINTVSGNTTNINTVSSNIGNINEVVTNLDEIVEANNNSLNITTVADNIVKAVAVADNINNVIIVADDLTNINSVASNKTNIDIAASNITEIQNASTNANIATTKALEASTSATSAYNSSVSANNSSTNASNSEIKASKWADNNYNVEVETGKYSAKHWATVSQNSIGVKVVENISSLKTFNINEANQIEVLGYYTKGDGGGGLFYWDNTSIETDNGGTIIQTTGVTTGRWKRVFSGTVNVKWFGAKGDGVADDTTSINNALRCGYYKVFAPSGTYKTTSPIEIPVLVTFYGDGNITVIKPTYSSWIGTDYRAIILETKEGINYHNRDFGKSIRDFSIEGVDSNMVQSIALDFRTKNPNSVVSSTVNFSLYSTFISNIVISRFDTALNIFELWASSFKSIFINECREAIHIEGQAVNNMFSHIQATNFTNSYTISTENTIGISVNSSNRYNGVEHRPEGFCFDSCLIFGAYNNVKIVSCLAFKMDKMILDGGTNVCVALINPADFILSNSYIYTTHNTLMEFGTLAAVEPNPVKILNNNFVGKSLSSVGMVFTDGGVRRQGVTISGNSFYNCGEGISAIQCPVYSHIINNTFYGNLSYTVSNIMIRVQNGGEGTLIDGNNTLSDVTILNCHAIVTSSKLKIGTNSSKNQSTKYSGKIIIPIGSTTASVPVGWTNTENGIRFIVSITCNESTVYKYVPETNYMNGTITIPSPLSSVATFRYTTTAVPYTAI